MLEKEVRRARKEAFKSSSALVQTQEELKIARNRGTLMREETEGQRRVNEEMELEVGRAREQLERLREELESQRQMKDEIEQEALQSREQLGALLEEFGSLRERLQASEEDRDALSQAMNAEKVARVAAEVVTALPLSREIGQVASPRKRRRDERESEREHRDPLGMEMLEDEYEEDKDELMTLKEDLRNEKRLRTDAEELAHFMRMECQFGCCACRLAERKGERYVHDKEFAAKMEKMRETEKRPQEQMREAEQIPGEQKQEDARKQENGQKHGDDQMQEDKQEKKAAQEQVWVQEPQQEQAEVLNDDEEIAEIMLVDPAPPESLEEQRQEPDMQPADEELIVFSPTSGTFSKATSPLRPTFTEETECHSSAQATASTQPAETPVTPPAQPKSQQIGLPFTPRPLPNLPYPAPRTISTTTTVPLKADDSIFCPAPSTPGGISREEALEQIRLRRGRARSFAVSGTPKKGKDGEAARRQISAPGGSGV